jgi:LmbE family N-acetylglucosaminyl deacetylase
MAAGSFVCRRYGATVSGTMIHGGSLMITDTTGELGNILGVWAHPDDEAYLSAGLMARAVDAGRQVFCLTATRGEAGFPTDDPRSLDERKALRQRELTACLEILGVTDHRNLGLPDGGCADIPDEEPVAIVAALIEQLKPDTVLTFGPDGGTGHPDHISACRWATLAHQQVAPAGCRLLYSTKTTVWEERFLSGVDRSQIMMVEDLEPERVGADELAVWFVCDEELLDRKVAALLAQASQVDTMVGMVGMDVYRELVREEFFRDRRDSDPPVPR